MVILYFIVNNQLLDTFDFSFFVKLKIYNLEKFNFIKKQLLNYSLKYTTNEIIKIEKRRRFFDAMPRSVFCLLRLEIYHKYTISGR